MKWHLARYEELLDKTKFVFCVNADLYEFSRDLYEFSLEIDISRGLGWIP